MASSSKISTGFWQSLVIVATISLATLFINDRMETTVQKALAPVIHKVEDIESNLLTIKSDNTRLFQYNQIQDAATSPVINFLNKQFKKDFIKPEDLKYIEKTR